MILDDEIVFAIHAVEQFGQFIFRVTINIESPKLPTWVDELEERKLLVNHYVGKA